MLNGKRITVVMPAYNAEKTLRKTHNEIPHDIVDNVILTDDASQDRTAEIAKQLNIKTFVHTKNKGYGGNQKTCYQEALRIGSDIIIMLHPDYQYTPKLITSNRFLTAVENLIIQQKLSEYHTGYRAFSAEVLKSIPLIENSDDFIFDNEMLLQTMYFGFSVGEVSCPAKYFEEASSISFRRSVTYGIGVLHTAMKYFFSKRGHNKHYPIFNPEGKKLNPQ